MRELTREGTSSAAPEAGSPPAGPGAVVPCWHCGGRREVPPVHGPDSKGPVLCDVCFLARDRVQEASQAVVRAARRLVEPTPSRRRLGEIEASGLVEPELLLERLKVAVRQLGTARATWAGRVNLWRDRYGAPTDPRRSEGL